jgi:hypothetical protein
LASRLDQAKLPDSLVVGFQWPDLKEHPAPEFTRLPAQSADPGRWRRASGNSTEFTAAGANGDMVFVPFNSIGPGERYSIYWKVV